MRKILRIILAVIFFIPSYPFMCAAFGILGLVPFFAFFVSIANLFRLLGTEKDSFEEFEVENDLKESATFIIMPFIMPFVEWYSYVTKGKFQNL